MTINTINILFTALNNAIIEQRNTICASEVFNECLYSYDRKVVSQIAEILAIELPKLGWRKERHQLPVYGNQINCYCRNLDDTSELEENIQTDSATDTTAETVQENVQTESATDVTAEIVQTDSATDDVTADNADNETNDTELNDVENNVADDVTLVSSQTFDSDDEEEEFLTDDELRQLHEEDF